MSDRIGQLFVGAAVVVAGNVLASLSAYYKVRQAFSDHGPLTMHFDARQIPEHLEDFALRHTNKRSSPVRGPSTTGSYSHCYRDGSYRTAQSP